MLLSSSQALLPISQTHDFSWTSTFSNNQLGRHLSPDYVPTWQIDDQTWSSPQRADMAVYDWASVQQTQNCLLPIYLYTLEKVTSLWVSERKLNDSKIPSNSEIS